MEYINVYQQDVSHYINQIYAEGEKEPKRTRKRILMVRQENKSKRIKE